LAEEALLFKNTQGCQKLDWKSPGHAALRRTKNNKGCPKMRLEITWLCSSVADLFQFSKPSFFSILSACVTWAGSCSLAVFCASLDKIASRFSKKSLQNSRTKMCGQICASLDQTDWRLSKNSLQDSSMKSSTDLCFLG